MYVGTIHGYCFKLLQDHVPKYGNYDVLDPNRHAGLLSREFRRLEFSKLEVGGQWASIAEFSRTVDIIGNELIRPEDLGDTPLGDVYRRYLDTLDRYHYLTFSLIIQKAVEALEDPKVYESVHGRLRHLIVDEFQDINPAQDALIAKLGRAPVHVCVVGDDDQAIYQWRGSDVSSIQGFLAAFKGAKSVTLARNRRSKKEIVDTAALFAKSIDGRLSKDMQAHRPGGKNTVVPWMAETAEDEAGTIAEAIADLVKRGFRYRDIAVLYRSVRTSAPMLIDALRERDIPYTCGGRTGLFLQPEIELLGKTYVWLAGWKWRPAGYGTAEQEISEDDLTDGYAKWFGGGRKPKEIRKLLQDWKSLVEKPAGPVNLVGDLYQVLRFFKVHEWDVDNPAQSARLGAFARFSNILADFENVTRRGRWYVDKDSGEEIFTGGTDRGAMYYQRLANFVLHYAQSAYEEFDGEDLPDLDAVDIVTVHGAKGLEWPVVFVPALSDRRFPSSKAGREQNWILPEDVFPVRTRRRYEGGENEERRLFYVAMTRARDALYLSTFERTAKQAAKPSRFLVDLVGEDIPHRDRLPLPEKPEPVKDDERPTVTISFSDLSDFDECGFRYRLANSLGFETQIAAELGYGKAVHHVLRAVAEVVQRTGKTPTEAEVEKLLDDEFYLPFANRSNFDNMLATARRMVRRYVDKHQDDLHRIWATERPFEMHVPDGIVSGRADVILDRHEGEAGSLAIVDYKTAKGAEQDEAFAFQLAVYTAAGRAEGLNVRAALLHNLDEGKRTEVDVGATQAAAAVAKLSGLVEDLRMARFVPRPVEKKCGRCEYRRLCKHAPRDPWEDD